MNLLTKIILIFLFASCVYFLYGQDCKAKVSIKTDIKDVKLFVDDIYIGQEYLLLLLEHLVLE